MMIRDVTFLRKLCFNWVRNTIQTHGMIRLEVPGKLSVLYGCIY